jgi:hypothetical protein
MIIRMLIKSSILISVLIQHFVPLVDAKIVTVGGESFSRRQLLTIDNQLTDLKRRNSDQVGTSTPYENLLRLRGGQAISGKKVHP